MKDMNKKYIKNIFKIAWFMICLILMATGCNPAKDTEETMSVEIVELPQDTLGEVEVEQEPEISLSREDESEADPKPEAAQVSIVMVGDILLHTPVEESALQEDGSYNYDAIFANTKDEIQSADLAIVNQEVIIGGTELGISGYPAFNAPFEIGHDLAEVGFDVVCHGTNHALDKGKQGLLNCINFWENNYPDIEVLGIHATEEDAEEIICVENNGIKIAVLNYTYSTNGVPMPDDMPFAVDMLTNSNMDKIVADIQKAEEQADFVIVCPHWGTEYNLEISSAQKKWTDIFLENGVDLVIGTHPHVIEPIEMITDEQTGHQMLVYYSLGNFVNWTSSTGEGIANRMVGGMAQVTIEKDESGNTYIKEYGIEELVCHLEKGVNKVTVYFLDEYTEELAEQNQIVKQDAAFSLQYCKDLVTNVWKNMY